jgi:hypothetical protein
MVMSFITLVPTLFLTMVSSCACHSHIPLLDMAMSSSLFKPPMTSCGHLCFRLVFRHHIGWKCSTLLPTYLICFPKIHFLSSVHILPCLAFILVSPICVFFGANVTLEHKRYHCLDLATNKIIISHHVKFDESSFPFAKNFVPPSSHFDFLSDLDCAPLAIVARSVAGITTPLAGQGVVAPTGSAPQVVASSAGALTNMDMIPLLLASVLLPLLVQHCMLLPIAPQFRRDRALFLSASHNSLLHVFWSCLVPPYQWLACLLRRALQPQPQAVHLPHHMLLLQVRLGCPSGLLVLRRPLAPVMHHPLQSRPLLSALTPLTTPTLCEFMGKWGSGNQFSA